MKRRRGADAGSWWRHRHHLRVAAGREGVDRWYDGRSADIAAIIDTHAAAALGFKICRIGDLMARLTP